MTTVVLWHRKRGHAPVSFSKFFEVLVFSPWFYFYCFIFLTFLAGLCSIIYFCLVKVIVNCTLSLLTCGVQQKWWEAWEWSALPGNSRKTFEALFRRPCDANCTRSTQQVLVSMSATGELQVPGFYVSKTVRQCVRVILNTLILYFGCFQYNHVCFMQLPAIGTAPPPDVVCRWHTSFNSMSFGIIAVTFSESQTNFLQTMMLTKLIWLDWVNSCKVRLSGKVL